MKTADIVIPLSRGSVCGNFELRMALRSIARYVANAGTVWLIAEEMPAWCRNLRFIRQGDPYRANKDANLFAKILRVCREPELTREFLFWSDDQVVLRPLPPDGIPPVYNRRGPAAFRGSGCWHARMRNTFAFLAARGIKLDWNWDSHVPQRFDKKLFAELIAPTGYAAPPGFCINTLYFGLRRFPAVLPQELVKVTCESDRPVTALNSRKLFLGYNDNALRSGLAQVLEKMFPAPCRYEAEYGEMPDGNSAAAQTMASSSTSKINAAQGGIACPAPRSP